MCAPHLWITAIYSIAAAGSWLYSMSVSDSLTRSFFFVVGLILAGMGFASFVHWLGAAHAIVLRDTNEARSMTEKVKMAEAISRMAPDQIRALTLFVPSILVTAGEAGPLFDLDLEDGKVPMRFVKEFFAQGNRQYMAPVRIYSDGTDERKWAQQITAYMVLLGVAKPAEGKYSAKWTNYDGAMYSLFGSLDQE